VVCCAAATVLLLPLSVHTIQRDAHATCNMCRERKAYIATREELALRRRRWEQLRALRLRAADVPAPAAVPGDSSSGLKPGTEAVATCPLPLPLAQDLKQTIANSCELLVARRRSLPLAIRSSGGSDGRNAAAVTPPLRSPGVAARRAPLLGRADAPLMHIEARHAQAEATAHAMVEEALLEAGIKAFHF
jgi:hypothetical protein